MIISAFIAITKRQHRLAAFQDLQEEARYVLDKIAKEIRMSEIDPEGEQAQNGRGGAVSGRSRQRL